MSLITFSSSGFEFSIKKKKKRKKTKKRKKKSIIPLKTLFEKIIFKIIQVIFKQQQHFMNNIVYDKA